MRRMTPTRIETDRLVIRSPSASDARAMEAIFTDPQAVRFLGVNGKPFELESPEQVERRVQRRVALEQQRGFTRWSVDLKESGETIGDCGLVPVRGDTPDAPEEIEVGYHFVRSHWGHGYATEAAAACLREAFTTHGLGRVIAVCEQGHTASERVMIKAGMKRIGTAPYFGEVLTLCEAIRDEWLRDQGA